MIRDDFERRVTEILRRVEDAPCDLYGFAERVRRHPEVLRDPASRECPASIVAEPPCDVLGRGQRFPSFPEITQRVIRVQEIDLHIERQLEGVSRLWDLRHHTHRLIEDRGGFLVGGSTKGLFPRTPKI